MKTKLLIQRLCLFLFVLVLAAPAAWATDYGRYGYEIFRSRKTVETLGKNKRVGSLKQGHVEVIFSNCKTTGGTGSGAIYELAKGSHINVIVDNGYAIRWIILRDTEGGKDYDYPEGIQRISRVGGTMTITSRRMPSRIREYTKPIRRGSMTTTTTSLSTIMLPRKTLSTSTPTTIKIGASSRCATSL